MRINIQRSSRPIAAASPGADDRGGSSISEDRRGTGKASTSSRREPILGLSLEGTHVDSVAGSGGGSARVLAGGPAARPLRRH
ncbi:hypothetical protein [Mycobacterium sp.]|uniref:hypothetical protein n=1 Tax=Mycobacterium sp. TaxID=1785 RepID=UPI003F956DF8